MENRHLNDYRYHITRLDSNYIEMIDEKNRYQDGVETNNTSFGICQGNGDSNYDVIRELNDVDDTGLKFFSKSNIKDLQYKIKNRIYTLTKGKIILEDDQNDSDLLIAMRAIYYQEGRFLPDNVMSIDYQVKKLNIKVLNYIIPDMLTNIKQQYLYIKEINEPFKTMDRPVNDSIKGRKALRSTFVY